MGKITLATIAPWKGCMFILFLVLGQFVFNFGLGKIALYLGVVAGQSNFYAVQVVLPLSGSFQGSFAFLKSFGCFLDGFVLFQDCELDL
jgi:hypothetical protein